VIERIALASGMIAALTFSARSVGAAPPAPKAIDDKAMGPHSRPIDANKAACASAYEAAQEERIKKQLTAARAHLVTCGATTCPAGMQRECIGWLSEVDAALPTVVVRAWVAGRETTDVRVLVDDHEVAAHLDGSAVPLDPGLHVFRFEHAGDAPIEESYVVAEGHKLAPIEARFTAIAAPRRIGWPVWVAAGTSAAGFASFVAFGAAGLVEYEHLHGTCSPNCAKSDSNDVKTRFAIADVSLGVGVVAAGVAAALFFTGKSSAPDTKSSAFHLDVGASRGGAFARVSTSF
jgi:hypothetical protein